MLNQRNHQPSRSISSRQKSLNHLLRESLILSGLLGDSITSLSKQISLESLSRPNTLSLDLYRVFLLIAKLLKLLLELKSLTGVKDLTFSFNLRREECGKSLETVVIGGYRTEANCPVENFEQLGLELYPGMP